MGMSTRIQPYAKLWQWGNAPLIKMTNKLLENPNSLLAEKCLSVSPHLTVVTKPIVERVSAWPRRVFRVAVVFPSAEAEL